jgi:hypothetical protein
MTWTKLGDEFGDATWRLSDAAFRTHVEALMWSNRLGLDLMIPKRHLGRFAFSPGAEAATRELCAAGWWKEEGDFWNTGLRFADWQPESAVTDQRRAEAALRQRRHRMHVAGTHDLCLPKHCAEARKVTRDVTHDPGRDGTGLYGTGRAATGTGAEVKGGEEVWPNDPWLTEENK